MALQIRRGIEADRLTITPSAGEIIYTTDQNKIYVGDGLTAGGDLVAGAKGQKGEVGTAGADGTIGVDGAAGDKGQKGEVGTAGADGTIGVDGAAGDKGQKGEVGTDGSDGVIGVDGADGAKGQKGEVGVTGPAGADGAAGAKGQIGEVGGAAVPNISESAPVSPEEGALWFDPALGKTFIYVNDGSSSQWVQTNPTPAAGAKGQKGEVGSAPTQTYSYEGLLEVHAGVKRFYSSGTYTISSVDAHLSTAASGSSVNISIKKNGVEAATLSLAADSTSSLSNALSVGLTQGDYITIDITQIGSAAAGTDLHLVFTLSQ